MPSSSPTSWAVWIIIILLLISCLAIIIWIAIDNNIPNENDVNYTYKNSGTINTGQKTVSTDKKLTKHSAS